MTSRSVLELPVIVEPPERLLLDTNIAIYLAKEHPTFELYREELRGKHFALGFVNAAELLLTSRKSASPERTLAYWRDHFSDYLVLAPDAETCEIWADISAQCLRHGSPRGQNDLWTAALAIRFGLRLVSHNRRHFKRIPGLQLITHG